jgi:hypothetical protein
MAWCNMMNRNGLSAYKSAFRHIAASRKTLRGKRLGIYAKATDCPAMNCARVKNRVFLALEHITAYALGLERIKRPVWSARANKTRKLKALSLPML